MTQQIINGQDALQQLQEWLTERNYPAIFILADSNTSGQCFPLIEDALQEFPVEGVLEIPPGEENKTIYCCEDVWEEMLHNEADRQSLLINLGGGLITDLGGFIASTFKRGIDYINLPTTLLGMTDAAIGGKTGINFRGIKNQLGTFTRPSKTIIYPPFLDTLDSRQFRSGFAEMIKHTLIASPNLWFELKQLKPTDKQKIKQQIKASAKVKQVIVEKDFQEEGIRKKLNFGHTIGHALESYSLVHDNKPLYHGEAVALGMRVESYLSHQHYNLDELDYEDIEQYLGKVFPDYSVPEDDFDELLDYMELDKKNTEEGINFTLLDHAGRADPDFFLESAGIKAGLNKILGKNNQKG